MVCGEPFEPGRWHGRGWGWGIVCPTCKAAMWKRLLKAVFWGGVAPLAFFLFFTFFVPRKPNEDLNFLTFMAVWWPICTIFILLPGVARYGGGWGNGGGGNGGG